VAFLFVLTKLIILGIKIAELLQGSGPMFGFGRSVSLGLAAVASMVVNFAQPKEQMRYDAPLPSRRYRVGENRAAKYKKPGGRKSWALQMSIEKVRAARRANVRRRQLERLRRGKQPRNNYAWQQ